MTEDTEARPPAADAESSLSEQLSALHAKLAEAEAAASAARDQHLRAVAEIENVRKRGEREADSARKFGAEKVLGDLLAVADSLDLGLKAASAPDATAKTIAEGIALTQKQLLGFFEKHGVQVVDPAGQPFNPDYHEAISAIPSPDVAPNHVIGVMQKGYRLHERLLRPAMVIVAKSPTNE